MIVIGSSVTLFKYLTINSWSPNVTFRLSHIFVQIFDQILFQNHNDDDSDASVPAFIDTTCQILTRYSGENNNWNK